MEVRPGYKKTEVGVIPKDWDAKPLRALVRYTNGKAHEQSINDSGRFVVVNSKFISTEGLTRKYSEHSFCPASQGDVLMVMSDVPDGRAIAKCYWVESENTYTVNQRICVLTARGVDGKLLFYKLDRNPFYLAFDDGAKQTNIRKDDVLACLLGIPKSEAEQRAIATALSDVDGLLGGLDRLIAKKRDLKQAAMQQLLTGQTRLPGFHGEWTVKSLSTICSMKSGEGITSPNINQFAQYPCYGGNGLRGYATRFTHDGKFALIGRQGALCGNVFDVEGKFFASEHAIVVTASADSSIRWLTSVLGRMNLNQYSESSAQPGLSVSKILILEIDVPPTKAEQTAIAEVLTDIDAELAALEQRREKTRALKRAMMQELLTGRTRLA